MSQRSILPINYPTIQASTASVSIVTLDAANEEVHLSGSITLEGGSAGGSKTLSTGKIHFRSGNTTTFANAGTTLRVGLQDMSAAASPGQGDGTFDVYDDLVGATDTITSSAIKSVTMSVGTKTVSHGDLLTIAFKLTARAGVDSVTLSLMQTATSGRPITSAALSAAMAKQIGFINAIIEFDDGSLGWFEEVDQSLPAILTSTDTAVTFNSTTGTADEYANLIVPQVNSTVLGVALRIVAAATTSDFEVLLYSDPLGTPVAERTITVSGLQLGTAGSQYTYNFVFPTEFSAKAGVPYAVSVRPTTANNVSIHYIDWADANFMKVTGVPSDSCYSVRRLNNTGAFSDYNGGTAKTRRMRASMIINAIPDDRSAAQSQIGLH